MGGAWEECRGSVGGGCEEGERSVGAGKKKMKRVGRA